MSTTPNTGDHGYNTMPIDSLDEINEGDNLYVSLSGGSREGRVTDTDGGHTRTPAVELEVGGATKLLIKDLGRTDSRRSKDMVLYEWRVGVEEDFADWRKEGTINNIERIERV